MYLQLPLFDRHTEAEKTSSISSAIKTIRATNGNHAACSPFSFFIQVSQVTSGPRRGPTFNNRWWNDRRSWNLRITNRREEASPKGANHILFCYCSPPSGTIRECISYPQVSFPSVIPPAVIHIRPPSGTAGCHLRNFSQIYPYTLPPRGSINLAIFLRFIRSWTQYCISVAKIHFFIETS